MGIIGANGAGKSTLMRAIAGILPPTQGRIEVRSRVSALLALGVGFNAALSGRENVVLGGLATGLSRKEIERYEEIAEFAELGDFMDMPMRTYSSGMYSRLAFSVSVHMNPDILLIDEALSAGDASFKTKAAAKMNDLVRNSRTMFLVSHAMSSVKDLCDDSIWLHKGKLMMRGEPDEVIGGVHEVPPGWWSRIRFSRGPLTPMRAPARVAVRRRTWGIITTGHDVADARLHKITAALRTAT